MHTLLEPPAPRTHVPVWVNRAAEQRAMARGRVLVVDDEALITDSFRLALEPASYTVRTAASANRALAEADGAEWDLAFVDLGLPDMDGLDLLRELKARRPGLVAVVITGHGSGSKGFAARDAGAYAFLEKPGDMTPEKILTVVANVLKQKAAERELEAARHQVAMNEKLSTLGTLVSGVAHEIRTPLTYVACNLYLLRQRLRHAVEASPDLEPLAQDLLKHETAALDGVARINRLVEDLRRFTTHRVGETVDADLRDVVAVAVDLFRATLTPVAALPMDKGQIQQVVLNLLNNSAEAMPAGGSVRVSTRAVPGGGEIEVEDHGTGLSPEVEALLFRPFFTTKPEGTGLGLSICRRIIEAHGGRIRYETRPRQGMTFVIFLPVRPGG